MIPRIPRRTDTYTPEGFDFCEPVYLTPGPGPGLILIFVALGRSDWISREESFRLADGTPRSFSCTSLSTGSLSQTLPRPAIRYTPAAYVVTLGGARLMSPTSDRCPGCSLGQPIRGAVNHHRRGRVCTFTHKPYERRASSVPTPPLHVQRPFTRSAQTR